MQKVYQSLIFGNIIAKNIPNNGNKRVCQNFDTPSYRVAVM